MSSRVVQQAAAQQCINGDLQLGPLRGRALPLACGASNGETGLAQLLQLIGQQAAGALLGSAAADQNDRHRSRSSFDSQPKPTNPSRKRRRKLRV